MPIAALVRILGLPELALFITSALAIVPLAKILGTATEELASRVGAGIGGLLNATFGNATELIIAIVALNAGLTEVVKASLTGSIIGNILFVLGLAMSSGRPGPQEPEVQPHRRQRQRLAVARWPPSVSPCRSSSILATHETNTLTAEEISLGVAVILLLAYAAQMVFFLRTHAYLYNAAEEEVMHGERWSIRHALIVLAGATLLIAGLSELLVEGVEYLTTTWAGARPSSASSSWRSSATPPSTSPPSPSPCATAWS